MADTYIQFGTQSEICQLIRQGRDELESGRDKIHRATAILAQMKDGGVVGTLIESECGCPNNAEAVALVGELESFDFKINTNDSQSNLKAAYDQFLARLGP